MNEEQFKQMERTLKLLQIPDAIKDIPPYNGSRTELNKLIEKFPSESGYLNILNNKKDIIKYTINQVEKLYKEILPKRHKRGLINGIGTLIKDITGNLDNQDLIDVQRTINEIDQNQDKLNNQINNQIQVNNQIINRLEEIQNTINNNLNRLQYEYNKTTEKINHLSLLILYDQHFYKINHVLEILQEHLRDLLDIIAFSKQRLVSRHLLTNNETEYIIHLLEQDNIKVQNHNFLYDLLELKGFYNNTKLIYIIKVPMFSKENYDNYQLKLIPFHNKIITPIPYNQIILNTQLYQFATNQCKRIYDTLYCKEEKLMPILGTCIPAIVNQQQAECETQNITIYEDIDYLSLGILYIQPADEPIVYTSTCNQQTYKIMEQTLMEFNNCDVNIQGQKFSTDETEFSSNIEIRMPYNEINIIEIKPELTLDILHNRTIQNYNQAKLGHEKAILHSSTGHISLTFITIFIILFIIYKFCWPNKIGTALGLLKQPTAHLRGEELRTSNISTQSDNIKVTSSPVF